MKLPLSQLINPFALNSFHDSFLNPGNSNHEKFIKITSNNGKELDSLKKRIALIEGFFEHSVIEMEPAVFVIRIRTGIAQVRYSRFFCRNSTILFITSLSKSVAIRVWIFEVSILNFL